MSHHNDGFPEEDDVRSLVASSHSTLPLTISEIHPDDSASRAALARRRRRRGSDGSDIEDNISETSIGPAVRSLHSLDDLYRTFGGRVFNSQSDVYSLPADDEEHKRLDMQHYAIVLYMNSLFPFKNKVRNIIRKDRDPPPEIFDVGAGSCRWALDMCETFPWVNILGLDIVPPARLSKEEIPPNLRLEIDDMNLSMEHYAETFDFVHARIIEAGLNDTESFIYEMARVLKPGGIFIMCSPDIQLWDSDMRKWPYVEPGRPKFCWLQYALGHVYRAYISRGGIGINGVLWERRWLEANPNFTEVEQEDVFIPLGPWKQGLNDREAMAANCMREDLVQAIRAFQPLLTAYGYRQEDIDLWTSESTKELREMSKPSYMRIRFLGATRTQEPWQERGMSSAPEDLTTRSRILGLDLTEPDPELIPDH